MGLIASETGLKHVDHAREKKQWRKYSQIWCNQAYVGQSTLKRFWRPTLISADNFYSICRACGLDDTFINDVVVDWENSTTPKENIKLLDLMAHLPPFGDKGCIVDTNRFFERKTIFEQLYQYLTYGWNSSLVGDFGMGKSSILRKLCQEGYQHLNLNPYSFLYFNLQLGYRPQYFLEAFSKALKINSEIRLNQFELQNILGNKRYIICLDEIGSLKLLPNSDLQYLLNLLRALAESQYFTLVTASHLPLDHLFPHSLSSAFADIFHQIDVPLFTEDEVEAFIRHRLKNNAIQFTDEQIEQLFRDSKGHPAKLQKMALDLYNYLNIIP